MVIVMASFTRTKRHGTRVHASIGESFRYTVAVFVAGAIASPVAIYVLPVILSHGH